MKATAVAPAPQAPPSQSAAAPTIASSVKSGFGFGIGNAIAQTISSSWFSTTPRTKTPSPEFTACMERSTYDECRDL